MFKKLIKMVFLTIFTYLLQATIPEYISIADVAPNIALSIMAVVSVGMGAKYTLLMSFTVGYLLEITQPAVSYLNLLLYPICAVLSVLAFGDRSEKRISQDRAVGKRQAQWNPLLRTILCAAMSDLLFECVHLLYTNLSGRELELYRYTRALLSVIYTTAITAIMQFPLRRFLGVNKLKKARM